MKMVGRKYEKKANKPIHLLKYNEHITIEKPKIVNEIRTALDWGHINELVWKATAKKNQSKHW